MKSNVETLESCMDAYLRDGRVIIAHDGNIVGFDHEEIPTQTANPSGDNE